MYYSTDIFLSAGLTSETSQYATLGMGGMNVLMTIVSLILIEKAGRKTLQLIGLAGMCVDVILLTICLCLKVSRNCNNLLSSLILIISNFLHRTWHLGSHTLALFWSSSTLLCLLPDPVPSHGSSLLNSSIQQLARWQQLLPSLSTGLQTLSSVSVSFLFR